MAAPRAQTMWRPAAASMRNLSIFWAAVAASGAAVGVASEAVSIAALAGVLAVAAVGGWIVGAVWSTPRVRAALERARSIRPVGWPPSPRSRASLDRAGRRNAWRAGLAGGAIGALSGFLPVFGPGVAAAGVAGLIGTVMLLRTVRKYETSHHAMVLSAQATPGTPRRSLELATVDS